MCCMYSTVQQIAVKATVFTHGKTKYNIVVYSQETEITQSVTDWESKSQSVVTDQETQLQIGKL